MRVGGFDELFEADCAAEVSLKDISDRYLSKNLNSVKSCLLRNALFSNVFMNSFILISSLLFERLLKYSIVLKKSAFVYALPLRNTTDDCFFLVGDRWVSLVLVSLRLVSYWDFWWNW